MGAVKACAELKGIIQKVEYAENSQANCQADSKPTEGIACKPFPLVFPVHKVTPHFQLYYIRKRRENQRRREPWRRKSVFIDVR